MEQEDINRLMADRERESKPKQVFNLNPARAEGYQWGGIDYKVPPLGEPGNPAILPTGATDHLLKHSQNAGTRKFANWLTTDEALFKEKLAELKKNGVVNNPVNPDVWACPTPKGGKPEHFMQGEKAPGRELFAERQAREKFLKKFGLWQEDPDAPKVEYDEAGRPVAKTAGKPVPVTI